MKAGKKLEGLMLKEKSAYAVRQFQVSVLCSD